MTAPNITGARRTRHADQSMTEEEKLARFAELRDSYDPHDAEQAMRLADELIERYMPLVGAVVRRWRIRMPSGMRMLGFDDLEAAGTCGLWEALLCFDLDQEQSFVSFASTRISWLVSGEVRKADPLGYKARRSVQRCWRAVAALEERLGREATEKEAAAAYGVSQKQYRKLRTWDLRSLNVELTEPLANYLSETDGDPLERLCAIEEALEGIGEDDQEIKEAAEEIGIAVENVKGYFSMEGAA